MIRPVLAVVALVFAAAPALAAGPAAQPDPAQQALVQMLQEAQGREAQALVQVYELRARLAAERARAEAAELRLKAAETPAEPVAKP